MLNSFSSVSPLLGGVFLILLGTGGLSTLVTLRLVDDGLPSIIIGLVSAMYMLGIFWGAMFTHRLISAVGHVRAFATFGSIMSAATLAHGFFFDPFFWGLLRLIVGVCAVGMYMCTESWLNSKTDNSSRGEVLCLYQMTVYLAFGSSQYLINISDDSGFLILTIMSVLMSLAIVPVLAAQVKAPETPAPTRLNFIELWRTSPSGMTVCFANGFIIGAIIALGPMYAQLIGMTTAQISTFMSAMIFGGLLFQWPLGKLSDKIDRRKVMLFASIAATILSAALALGWHDDIFFMHISIVLFGGFAYTLYPLAVAYTNDYLEPNLLVAGAGGLLMANGLGTTLGPLIGSAFVELSGPNGLFLFCAVVSLLTCVIIILRMKERDTINIDDQTDFEFAPRTSPIVYELHPGGED